MKAKLKGLPHIYYINLDAQQDRRKHMEEQFRSLEITDYTRISAYDGRTSAVNELLVGETPKLKDSEIACTCSHLNAIKTWLSESSDPWALIFEDDLDLSSANYWPFTWEEFVGKLPYDWDIIQLSIINSNKIAVNIHPHFIDDCSAAAYLISRHHAEKLMRLHCEGDRYRLDNGVLPRPVSEDLLFVSGKTYTIPLFLYRTDLGSSIHDPEHLEIMHEKSKNRQWAFWKEHAQKVPADDYFHYDPFNRHTILLLRFDGSVARH